MTLPRSLQGRLALSLGVLLSVLWLAAAAMTGVLLRHEMDEVFDSALQETAQRILPLAVVDIIGREEDHTAQRLAALRAHEEYFTYIVRDGDGRVVLQSHGADPSVFPAWSGAGFAQDATHRFYNEETLRGTIRITVAEPLAYRTEALDETRMGLLLPLVVVVPLTLLLIVVAVRTSLSPLRRFRTELGGRGANDLTAVSADDLPAELAPLAESLNTVLARLRSAFEAERSFAANAAHELRTPLAGAIAQAQRLVAVTDDPDARARGGEIEATLKRLTRLSERLMQLARAEGGRLRLDHAADLRPILRLLVDEAQRKGAPGRIRLTLPEGPVMSDLDPDAFGILCTNLIGNALRHGDGTAPVEVTLTDTGEFSVSNDGPVLPPDTLARLTHRFERAGSAQVGSGLGLAIARAIAEGAGADLALHSPRLGRETGFEASVTLPLGGEMS